MSNRGIITGIGAANIDINGLSRNSLILHDSNPGDIYLSPGGVTRNMIENIARMGGHTRLITAVGDDPLGKEILRSVSVLGSDVSCCRICVGKRSSTYLAILDADRDMHIAVSDMHILESITPEWLESNKTDLQNSAAILIDPCLPESTLDWLTSGNVDGVPIFADPVSTTYAMRLEPFIGKLFCLKPNIMELETLSGITVRSNEDVEHACEVLLNTGLQRVVVSLGKNGCYWADRDGTKFFFGVFPVDSIVSPTGAGDSFMAGLVYAYISGFDPKASVQWATGCSTLTVCSSQAVNTELNNETILKIITENKV